MSHKFPFIRNGNSEIFAKDLANLSHEQKMGLVESMFGNAPQERLNLATAIIGNSCEVLDDGSADKQIVLYTGMRYNDNVAEFIISANTDPYETEEEYEDESEIETLPDPSRVLDAMKEQEEYELNRISGDGENDDKSARY